MLKFKSTATGIELEYTGDIGTSNQWVWDELSKNKNVTISQVFQFKIEDLLNPPTLDEDFDEYVYQFQFGTLEYDYVKISGDILGIKNVLLISCDLTLKRSIFVAERNISIFGRLSKLLEHSDPIVIGGTHPKAIPLDIFEELLKKFPNTNELNRYADARVQTILSQYLDGMKDARGHYENYLKKKTSLSKLPKLDLDSLKKLEIEKYLLLRDLIDDALKTKINWSEGQ
ncbi:MAG: hypothetical protein ACRC8N_15570, partial [Aeromonas veronii]